jgi:acetyl-CoA acetyltransferase family protein
MKERKERIAIIDGVRTPMCKASGQFAKISADDLGAIVLKELMYRTNLPSSMVDEVIFGNVSQPANAANITRVLALKAGLNENIPAATVHRNCASGMEALSTSANKILANEASVMLCGGTESMSNIPLLFGKKMTSLFANLMRAKSIGQKLKVLSSFRLPFLAPVVGLLEGLTDPVCGLIMGLTAENLSRDFFINREEQDKYALESHLKASRALEAGIFDDEVVPVIVPKKYQNVVKSDDGPRKNQNIEALQKMRPYFDRKTGTVTVGNACQITDGAGAVLVMKESKAKELGLTPLGYLKDHAYAGLEPSRMGLGPVYATAKVLKKSNMNLKDIDLFEMNEAFAVQVLANLKAFESDSFCKKNLNLDKALGTIDPQKLNVNGGAIALGHPVGMTGIRLVITILKEMKRRGLQTGCASLCIGGGQGASFILEAS